MLLIAPKTKKYTIRVCGAKRNNESPSGAFKRQNGLAAARWREMCIRDSHCAANDDIHVLNLIFDTNTHDFCHSSRFFPILDLIFLFDIFLLLTIRLL